MTAQLHEFPVDATIFDRLTEQQRLANIQQERAEAIDLCKEIIDNPRGYTDDQLREVCGFYMGVSREEGGGGVHYLLADARISEIEDRERKRAHEAARRANETPAQIAKRFLPQWPLIAGCAAVLAVLMLAAMGWL